MHLLQERGLDAWVPRQKPVKETGAALLRTDHEIVGQRSHPGGAQPADVPDGVRFFVSSLHLGPVLGQS
jgi:hypothetical protein